MNTIMLNGRRYVPLDESGDIKIVVLERDFVYVGRTEIADGQVTIRGARAVIRWGTTQHLAQLVNGPLLNTKLGAAGTVRAMDAQLIHTLEVNQDAWSKHID